MDEITGLCACQNCSCDKSKVNDTENDVCNTSVDVPHCDFYEDGDMFADDSYPELYNVKDEDFANMIRKSVECKCFDLTNEYFVDVLREVFRLKAYIITDDGVYVDFDDIFPCDVCERCKDNLLNELRKDSSVLSSVNESLAFAAKVFGFSSGKCVVDLDCVGIEFKF
jgi:hypothetical protein